MASPGPMLIQRVRSQLTRTRLVCGLRGHRPEVALTPYGPIYELRRQDHTTPDGSESRCWCGEPRQPVA